jgi:glutamine amidotransferase
MVVIIDYGIGNVGSIYNMLKKIGTSAVVSSDRKVIEEASHIILPGVGLFDVAVNSLAKLNLLPILNEMVLDKKIPILGICLGMQLFTKSSEEGGKNGLAWLDAKTIKFDGMAGSESLKVPHMGWNVVNVKKKSKLFPIENREYQFYFLHSYYVKCSEAADVLTETYYGNTFVSAFEKDNIVGVQFHPEKSHKFGLEFFSNFIEHF